MGTAVRNVLIYGAVAALALSSLKLLSIFPLFVDWGRELAAAVVALVGVVVGIILRERGESQRRGDALSQPESRDIAPTSETVAASLSPREREVLLLLAEGLSNKQMARRLNVSDNTVKTHLANAYNKLGVNKRVQAVMAVQRLQIAGDHPKITHSGDGSDRASSAIVPASTTLPRS